MQVTSSMFSLDLKDIGKGLIVSVGGAVVAAIETSLQSGLKNLNWGVIGSVALAAGISYLGKNFFTPAKVVTPITGVTKVTSLSTETVDSPLSEKTSVSAETITATDNPENKKVD